MPCNTCGQPKTFEEFLASLIKIDANGNYGIAIKGYKAETYNVNIPVTGFSFTIGNSLSVQIFQPAALVPNGTIIMPANPVDGQRVRIAFADYGVTTDGLVGWRLPRSIQISEIKRQITEGILTKCPCCVSVSNWVFDNGTFSFTVKTDTGEEVTISDF